MVEVVVGEVDDLEDDVELLEVPHALTAAAARTSTTRSAKRRSIMPPSSRTAARSWSNGPVGAPKIRLSTSEETAGGVSIRHSMMELCLGAEGRPAVDALSDGRLSYVEV